MNDADCLICQKHHGAGSLVGPLIYADDLIHVSHRATGQLGYLFIESVRHVPHLDDLEPHEARAIGEVRTRLAQALRDLLEVERIQSMVIGGGVAHFHEHVIVRHRGTPADTAWYDTWSGAPRGDTTAFARALGCCLA